MTSELPAVSDNIIEVLCKIYGREKEDMLKRLVSTPKTSTVRVNTRQISLKDAATMLEKYFQASNDYQISPHTILPDVLLIKQRNLSTKRLDFYEKEIMVDTDCGTAVLRGADIFAPGVLAASASIKKGDKVSVYADLEKKCRRGYTKKFTERKFFVGNGVCLYDRNEMFENNAKLKGIAVNMSETPYGKQPSFSRLDPKYFYPQNFPSVVVGHVLDPEPDDHILDMCAAPGGKTTHIATLIGSKGKIYSIDKTQKKIERLKENCSKLLLSNVHCHSYDSTKLCDEKILFTEKPLGPPFAPLSFKKIILDPPCSGLGQRPQLRYIASDQEIQSYPRYQRKLIEQAYKLLKVSGTLIYSTCTLLPQENEEQVAWILCNFPGLQLVDQKPRFGRNGLIGFGLDQDQCSKVQRFDWCFAADQASNVGEYIVQNNGLTTEEQNTDFDSSFKDTIGFFLAKFVKMKT